MRVRDDQLEASVFLGGGWLDVGEGPTTLPPADAPHLVALPPPRQQQQQQQHVQWGDQAGAFHLMGEVTY